MIRIPVKTLKRGKFFPYKRAFSKDFRHYALIGLGGNIGDVCERFDRLARIWLNNSFVRLVQSSYIIKTPPFGYLEQNDFYNTLVLIETSLSPKSLLRYLMRLEARFGRIRTFKNAPRTLDLDIIWIDRYFHKDDILSTPHPYWQERPSVWFLLGMMLDDMEPIL